MKPAPFAYHRARSVDDALGVLSGSDGVARVLAGGQSLVPMLNLRLAPVDTLIDLVGVDELKQVVETPGSIRYGALVTHAAFEHRRVPDATNGLMPFIAARIAYRAVRTRGTIGGALALADPAADWLSTAIALEATIVVVGPRGRREIPATDFVIGPYTTVLDDFELIEAIDVPRRATSERWGHCKIARKVGEYADSMAIVLVDGTRRSARVVLGAVDGAPIVLGGAACAVLEGHRGAELSKTIRAELLSRGREFSAAKLMLHTNVAKRAIEDALTK